MPKYEVQVVICDLYIVEVEAENEDEAKAIAIKETDLGPVVDSEKDVLGIVKD